MRENGADWAALYQGLRCGTYQQPDAQGEKSPMLRRQMKLQAAWLNPGWDLSGVL